MLFTKNGMAVRFDEGISAPLGRVARGVRGVTLRNEKDAVVSCEVVTRIRKPPRRLRKRLWQTLQRRRFPPDQPRRRRRPVDHHQRAQRPRRRRRLRHR